MLVEAPESLRPHRHLLRLRLRRLIDRRNAGAQTKLNRLIGS